MVHFFKEAFAELEHVVWPTKRETQAYFKIVVIFIIIFTIFLFVLGMIFGESLFAIKDIVSDPAASTNVELIDSPTSVDIIDDSIEEGAAIEITPDATEAPATDTDDTSSDS